ncbi:MAG: chemotaxis protein CheW [Nostoc sp. DedVER02]|uniref:chemotaxis protein CheW n=1 Tax=unclassified Nostoc TaxID=2593658 RepID=UPI002AD4FD24|nr:MULTISPECIES: chemotaxis protein CheW [unclassified Nostoc]MDZ7985612.1 chemotaxis protein CheW [Nostoc sp. DedVER02]MDZ8113026.1 chemotaxis protein CheW [Nostoc sp. DedVER01b]
MNPTTPLKIERCWNSIGIEGDRSCPQLATYTHCRNCPVYSTAGRYLLERSIPEDYRHQWTELLAKSRTDDNSQISHTLATIQITVVIFRLQREWLALSAQIFKEISPANVVHTIPHRSNQILRGLVSIRGELLLCISLSDLLNLETADTAVQTLSPVVYSRMVVLEKADKTWVFGVDELYGVHRFHRDELQDPPKSLTQTYTKGLFHWQPSGSQMERSVSYLDDELLFTTLARKVL